MRGNNRRYSICESLRGLAGIGFAVTIALAAAQPTDRQHDAVNDTKDEDDEKYVANREIVHVGSLQGRQRLLGSGVSGLKIHGLMQCPNGSAGIAAALPANAQQPVEVG